MGFKIEGRVVNFDSVIELRHPAYPLRHFSLFLPLALSISLTVYNSSFVKGTFILVTENVMKGDGFLYRMMKYNKDRYLAAIAPCKIAGQTFFYVLFKDAHLHVYSVSSVVVEFCA